MPLDIAALYQAHHRAILAYVRKRVADPAEADDIAARVWERALRAAPRYRDTGAPVDAWLYRIARNLIVDGHRTAAYRQRRLGHTVPLSALAWSDEPAVSPPDPSAYADLAAAVARLPEHYRAVIRLRYLDGLGTAETAAAFGRSREAVKQLTGRARAALRRTLGAA